MSALVRVLPFAVVGLLAACQGAPTTSSASSPPAAPTAPVVPLASAAGGCAAPAVVVDSAGKGTLVGSGASTAAGICVPVREAGTTALETKSTSGKFRVTLESGKGKPDSADPKGNLLVRVYDVGSGAEVSGATVVLVLMHSQMGQGHGFDPNGLPTRAEGGYKLDPIAWPMAGTWVVTAKIKAGGADDTAHWAVNVI